MGQVPFVSTAEINAFVDRNLRNTIIDERFQSKALLGIIRGTKRLIKEDGGSIISQPILAQPNQTAITYSGADVLPTDSQEEFTTYELQWKQAQVSVTINTIDKLRVSGKRAQLDLVKNKIESAYMALFDKMGQQVYANGTGNASKDWDGIGGGIANASMFQNYLGIDRLANPWWQAQVLNPGAPTNLSTASMMTLWMQCKTDEERIHLIVATKIGYATYWGLLTPQEWFVDPRVGNLGFENIAFQGSALVDDSGCPANTMYFVNLDHVRMVVHRDRNFDFDGFIRPINQDTDTGHVFVAGNFEVRKPASCGVYINIANG
ncbi:MAG: phage major capsid protein [Candidatus Cybelea sp.]